VKKSVEEMTDCDGCSADRRLFSGALDCSVRKCVTGKGLKTCAHCDEYPCKPLMSMLQDNPSQKSQLDILRAIR